MNNQVAPMQGIADKVKERIKEQFADLIPDDVYKTLVEAALQDFVKNDLPNIVKAEAKVYLLDIVRAEIAKPEWWQPQYTGGGQQLVSEMVGKLLKEHSADIVQGMMGTVVMNIVQSMRNSRLI